MGETPRQPTTSWLIARLGPIYVVLLVASYLIGGQGVLIASAIVGAIVLPLVAALVRCGVRKISSFG